MALSSKLQALLARAAELGASDLHIHSGARLRLRVNGVLAEKGDGVVTAAAAEALFAGLLDEAQASFFAQHGQIDLAADNGNQGRARCNLFRQQRGVDGVFRLIAPQPPSLEGLMLPPELQKLTAFGNGLVLVCGPAGSGKTSTLAALLDIINRESQDHIITIEDPVEYVHPTVKSLISQRQVGMHTRSFAAALRAALREDPDVIMVGELRDLESISLALTAAETGHLVFSTMHTRTAIESINRLINVFKASEQPQVRAQLADSLRAVISQRLVPTVDNKARMPALELLLINSAVRGLILDSKTEFIFSIQELRREGMCTLDQALSALVRQGSVTSEAARRYAVKPENLAG